MELIIVLAISRCLTDHQNLSDCKQARNIAHGVGWGFGGSGDVAHTVGHGREQREDPIPRWQAQTVGKGLNSSLNRPPASIRLLECPRDTAADFSHIDIKSKDRCVGGDATSLPIQAMGVIYLPLLGYWLDTLLFSVGEVSASP